MNEPIQDEIYNGMRLVLGFMIVYVLIHVGVWLGWSTMQAGRVLVVVGTATLFMVVRECVKLLVKQKSEEQKKSEKQ